LKSIKSSITWCTVLGLVVGYFGIPVHPAAYAMWVWNRPYGLHIASILIFGTLGCLVGLFFHYWIWERLNREVALWITAVFSLALVFGTIGVFRYQAYNETVMWTEVNTGFVRTLAASRDNVTNTDEGIQMTQAGADIQAGVTMAGRSGINIFGRDESQKLSSIASAFSEAGYYVVSQNKDKLQESIQFVKQSGAIIGQINNQSYPNKTNHLEEITSKIYNLIPDDFVEGWQAN
jgi:hypothetical protein